MKKKLLAIILSASLAIMPVSNVMADSGNGVADSGTVTAVGEIADDFSGTEGDSQEVSDSDIDEERESPDYGSVEIATGEDASEDIVSNASGSMTSGDDVPDTEEETFDAETDTSENAETDPDGEPSSGVVEETVDTDVTSADAGTLTAGSVDDSSIEDTDADITEASPTDCLPDEELTAVDQDCEAVQASAGSTFATAKSIAMKTEYTGTISTSNTADYYAFTLNSSGRVTITSTVYDYSSLYFAIYDDDQQKVYEEWEYYDSATGLLSFNDTVDLTSGSYYFVIYDDYVYSSGTYDFTLTFSSAGESFSETQGGSNNSISAADALKLNTVYKGQIALNDTKDYYEFTLSTSGKVTLTLSGDIEYVYCYIYDASQTQLYKDWVYADDASEQISVSESWYLTSGTYYLAVVGYGYSSVYSGNYSFKIGFTSSGESFRETQGGNNNSYSTADSISLNTTYKGQLAENDTKDCYKFKLTKANTVTLTASTDAGYIEYYIYDSQKNELASPWPSKNAGTGYYEVSKSISLSAGTYYLVVTDTYITGNYSFQISNTLAVVTLSNTSYTYNGKVKKPSVTVKNTAGKTLTKDTHYTVSYASGRKNIGTYKVIVKGKGEYAGTSITKTFKIVPKKVTISSKTKSSSKKKLTVKWTKVGGSVKYQIYYRQKGTSAWKKTTAGSSSSSKTITKLKSGKKYQVKVRAYKKVSGKTYYGSWSSVKTVTVK